MNPRIILLLLLIVTCPAALWAKPFTLRLVCADRPDTMVSEVETVEEKATPESGKEEQEKKPRLPGKYVGWMRFITLDGQDAFKLTYKGAYLKRSAVITVDLADGEHVIEPGQHRFSVRDGRIITEDRDLHAAGDGLDIVCHPVTVVAVDASVVRKRPLKLKSIPIDLILKHGETMILPVTRTFNPLVLYMLSNEEGPPYRLTPTQQAFRVTAQGVQIEDTEEARASLSGVSVENQFTVGIPCYSFPIRMTTRRDHKVGAKIYGFSGEGQWLTYAGEQGVVRGFYSRLGSKIKIGHGIPSEPLPLEGDVAAYPYRLIRVDAQEPAADEPRAFVAAWKRQSFRPGEEMQLRIHYLDSVDRPTLAPAEIAVFFREKPIVDGECHVDYAAGQEKSSEGWTRLLCRQDAGTTGLYHVPLPSRPTNIYRCRIAMDRSGAASPLSTLAGDFDISISSGDKAATLSVFTDSSRTSYQAGELLEFNVVLKNREPLGGLLEATLENASSSIPLVKKDLSDQPPGHHTFTFQVSAESTASLSQGSYRLAARLGSLQSNTLGLHIRQPTPRTHFPIFSYPWGAGHHLRTTVLKREDNPNLREEELRRNVRHLTHMNFTVLCQPDKAGYSSEQRDSKSFHAVVEKMMREDLCMPASELVYNRTKYEILLDEMARHGQRFMPQSWAGMMLSVHHTILDDRLNTGRVYALLAQDYRRFPSWIGFLAPTSHVSPLGNSETGDPRWGERNRTLERNFRARHGHDQPREDQIVKWVRGDRATRERLAEIETQWMRWIDTINGILTEAYRDIRAGVGDLKPDMKLGAMTMQGSDAEGGEFITKIQEEMNINLNSVGYGDYARLFPLEEVVETMLANAAGPKTAQWRDIGDGSTAGRTNAKVQFFKSLMGKVDGLGYFSYAGFEVGIHPSSWFYDEYREFNQWLVEHGDWYQCLERDTPLCVYLSYLDSAHDLGVVRPHSSTAFLARGAVYELALAHRIAPIIGDERVRAGDLNRFRMVLLPAVRFVPDDVRAAFEEFIRQGGMVLADEDTEVEIQGATRIPKNFQTMLYPYLKIGCQYDGNRIFWEAYKRTRPEVAKLRRILDPIAPAFASAPSGRILTSTMRHGDARYVFVVNDDVPYWTEPTHFGIQLYTLPQKTQVTIRDTESVIYSVMERKTVQGPKVDGGRVLDVDFEIAPAQIYALLPKPIAALEIGASESARPGEGLRISARILDAAGQTLRAAVPFELKILRPSGDAAYEIYRSTLAEGYEEVIPIGLDAAPGPWRVEAREFFTGHKASVEFAVQGSPLPVRVVEAGEVMVADGGRVKAFLNTLQEKKLPFWILMGTDQSLRVGPLARRCAEQLRKLGIRADVKLMDDPQVTLPPNRVERPDPQTHIPQHVLLLGLEGENQLIEEICDTSLLLRRFSRNYPGNGRAVIEMAMSPFALDYHALLVLSPDLAGLEKGVERLAAFANFDQETDLLQMAAVQASPIPLKTSPSRETVPLPDLIEEMEGVPPSVVAFSPDGNYFAVGCNWYFSNLFLFERTGKLLWKQKVGRVEVNQLSLSPGAERVCATTDQGTYLLDKGGKILWRLRQPAIMNAAGDLLFSAGADLTLALRPDGSPLWIDDPWLEETDPWRMNDSNNLEEIYFLNDNRTVVLRNGAEIEFRDAATNRVLRKFIPEAVVSMSQTETPRRRAFRGKKLSPTPDGQFIGMVHGEPPASRESYGQPKTLPFAYVFRNDGQLVQNGFLCPPYYGDYHSTDSLWVSKDGNLFSLCKDTVYRARPDGSAAWSYSFHEPLVSGGSLSPDGSCLAVASWGGKLALLDTRIGNPLWVKSIESGAELAFSPDGQLLVAGGKTGVIRGFNLQGDSIFQHDLRQGSYMPQIEDFWANQDRNVNDLRYGNNPPWHETLQRNVPLSANLLPLTTTPHALADTLEAGVPGEKFATYFFAMRYHARSASASFRVSIQEQDASEATREVRASSFEARSFVSEHYWVFKLSDQPSYLRVIIEKQTGEGEILFDELRLHKLEYPSENFLYHRGAYSLGKTQEVMDNAAVNAAIYHMLWGSHTTVEADPFYLMDGHVFQKQEELSDGWWFGGGAGAFTERSKVTPCAIDFEFPEPRAISHIALFDDEDGEATERVCFQAWIEAKDLRRNKSENEERQIKAGYWRTVGKSRWNREPFQVFKFEDLITDKIRFWYLRGPLKINEIEIYGPEQKKVEDWFDKSWIARIPVKVNRVADLAEVEFQPLGLTRPDGADLRVISPFGKEVPYVVKQLTPSGTSALAFSTGEATGSYYIYLGNDSAAPPSYHWKPEGGIWMESYPRPERVDGEDTRAIYNEAVFLKFFNAAKTQALEARKKAEAEGKSYGGCKTAFVRSVGYDALPDSITRYAFTLQFGEACRIAFITGVSSEVVPSMLKVNDQIVFGGWNAWEPGKQPAGWAAMPGKHWGDAEVQAGYNRFEFYFAGLNYPAVPLTFRPAEGRAERVLLLSRHTCFPEARRLLPEKIQLLEEKDLGQFYLHRGRNYVEQEKLFDAQEMLLFAAKFLKDAAARSEAKNLAAEISARIGATQWPMFHRNPARTGFAPVPPPTEAKESSGVTKVFGRLTSSTPFDEQLQSGIAATDLGIFFGNCHHRVHQLGGWFFTTGGIIQSTPLVYGQRVYCGSMDGNMYCLTAGLGELVWKFPTGDGIPGSPFLVDEKLVFGSLDGYLYCIDPLDGQPIWKYRTEGWIEGSPATDGQMVFVGSYDDCLHAVNLQTGKMVWKFKTGFDIACSPCVENGVVYSGSDDGHMYALKASDGSLLWKTMLSDGYLHSSPALAQGVLVIGGEDDYVYALDAATGAVRWKHQTGDDIEASPAILGDQVYVSSNDNHIYAFRLADGALLARTPFAGNPATRSMRCSPAYHKEALWLGGTTDLKAGQVQRWER